MIAEHMGALHPVEHLMVLLLAFGPFAVLAVVITVVRRRDLDGDPADRAVDDRDEQDSTR